MARLSSVIILLMAAALLVMACRNGSTPTQAHIVAPIGEEGSLGEGVGGADLEGKTTITSSGLKYRDLVVGTGEAAVAGMTAVVHYTGWLSDGTMFDSSLDRGVPFEFTLGAGRVIRGWDEGVPTMKIGGIRELIIPPDLGYGELGAGGVIPPDATLRFEIKLLELR